MSAIADYPLPQQRLGQSARAVKPLEEMFTSAQVNRFLFRVKEQPQETTIVAQKTVQSKRIMPINLSKRIR